MSTDLRTPKPESSPRLMSLDALRGFDMFWIVGADGLVEGLRELRGKSPLLDALHNQLQHVRWYGFHFEDLIFPMFVFISGVSLVFSLTRTVAEKGKSAAVVRIVRRAVLLYLLGIFTYGGFSGTFEHIRLLGVLQRIAIAYLFAGLIFVFFGLRGRIFCCVALLLGYWAMMAFIPVPGGTAGDFDEAEYHKTHPELNKPHNLANWVDANYLPLRKWDGDHDPEGLLSTLPAIANCLIGVFAGMLLLNGRQTPMQKAAFLAVAGAVLAGLGWIWGTGRVTELVIVEDAAKTTSAISSVTASAELRQACQEKGIAFRVVDVKASKPDLDEDTWVVDAAKSAKDLPLLCTRSNCGRVKVVPLPPTPEAAVEVVNALNRPQLLYRISDVIHFPVIKKIWTSSFVLVACGYSSLLLAAFYLVIDVAGWRRWAMPFVWIGLNPITIYILVDGLGVFNKVTERLVGGELNELFHIGSRKLADGQLNEKFLDFGPLVSAIVSLLLVFPFAWFLYRRKVFIRL